MKQKRQQHGKKGTKLYTVWTNIKQRCSNTNKKDYKHYGGRGITMKESWIKNFLLFESYVTSLPNYDSKNLGNQGLTLDRIDNNGDYCDGNLRWTTAIMQRRNRRKPKSNKTGFIGVSLCNTGKVYRAKITINKKQIHIGQASTAKEAYQLRLNYIKMHDLKCFESTEFKKQK